MKKIVLSAIALFVVTAVAYSAGQQRSFSLGLDKTNLTISTTYVNSQVDTLIVTRQASWSGFSFSAKFGDSVSVTNVVVRRVVDGTVAPVFRGTAATPSQDSLNTINNAAGTYTFVGETDASSGSGVFSDGNAAVWAVTLAPAVDQYLIIVKYAASANGGSTTSTNTVKYTINPIYSRR